jgi:hypothetical protein
MDNSYKETAAVVSNEQQILDSQITDLAEEQTKPNGFAAAAGRAIDRSFPDSTVNVQERTQGVTHSETLDPFDPSNYKKPQDPRLNPSGSTEACGLPTNIFIGKPKKQWFIRFHPVPAYRAVLPLLTDDDAKRRDSSDYLFVPQLAIPPDLESLVRDNLVVAAITSAGIPFLYKLAVTDSSWYESGLELILRGTDEWVRVTPADGCYVTSPPIARLEEPRFPSAPFHDWLERAFTKRLITSLDHPIVKKLRGGH